MFWILEIIVTGFLMGEPALQFDGVHQDKFSTEKECNDFKITEDLHEEVLRISRIARRHLNDRNAEIRIKFNCVVDGEPA